MIGGAGGNATATTALRRTDRKHHIVGGRNGPRRQQLSQSINAFAASSVTANRSDSATTSATVTKDFPTEYSFMNATSRRCKESSTSP